MKKFLFIIGIAITFSFAIKCTDAFYKTSPAMNYLNHNYILVQRNYLDIFQKDTNYREVYFHWKGTISNHKLDWYENTRYILDSQKEDPPYSQKANAMDDGEDISYTEDNFSGHLVHNSFNTKEDKDAKKTSPYYSSDIDFAGDTIIQKMHRLTDDRMFIKKIFLKNDTLFYWENRFYGASKDSVIRPDTTRMFYINDSENEGLCYEYIYKKDSLKFVLNVNTGVDRIHSWTQHGDSLIYTQVLLSEYNSKKEGVFLPIEMVLEKGSTTAIKKQNILQQPAARRNHYYDLKGRTHSKQIPYRVFF